MNILKYIVVLAAITLLNTTYSYSDNNNYLNNIDYAISDEYINIEISLTGKTGYKINRLSYDLEKGYDNRIYIDFAPSILDKDIPPVININHQDLKRIRTGQFDMQTSRVVFDLGTFLDYEIRELSEQPYRIAINFITNSPTDSRAEINNTADHGSIISDSDKINENESISDESIEIVKKTAEKSDREDTFDPDDSPTLAIEVTDKLSLGAKLNFELEASENQEDLDDDEKDGLVGLTTRFSVAGQYLFSPDFSLFVQGNFTNFWNIEDSTDQQSSDTKVRLARAYILWTEFLHERLDLQAGRQRVKDDREWIVDEELDAFRIFFINDPIYMEFSVSSILFENDILLTSFEIDRSLDDEDKAINYFLYSTYEYDRKESISLFGLARQERDGSQEDRLFLGSSWRGRPIFKRLETWIDSAVSFTKDDNNDWVKGFGIDGGLTKSFRVKYKPSFTIASALGTKNFRQTGLQDNNSKFDGFTNFKYYGETFDPELANLYIATAGIGIIPFKKTSIDMVYHYYLQIDKIDEIVDSDIDVDPTGASSDIGQELDLIIGSRLNKYIKMSLTGGVFFPGGAYEENDPAYFGEVELQFSLK